MSLPPWRQAPVQTMHAYTPVGARRGFDAPPPTVQPVTASFASATIRTTQPEPKPSQTKKIAWPQEVRDYVSRSFDSDAYIPGIERSEVEVKLKNIINEAAEKGSLFSVDWAAFPLPQHLIQQERKRALAMNGPVAFNGSAVHGVDSTYNAHTNPMLPSSAERKRKSEDVPLEGPDPSLPTPPWRQNPTRNPFEDRLTYATQEQADRLDKRQRKGLEKTPSKFQNDLEKRKQRFQNGKARQWSPEPRLRALTPDEVDTGPVIGTCQSLEKKYFRLTSAPKPETVRPLNILKQTLDLLKTKWRKENNYGYICDQFKSLRQDLTVQHIKNEFTVTVYEIHARIALEKGDLGEYNQCQTQLRALYSQKLGGNPAEFLAYRILYFIHTNNRSSMNDVLADLTATDKEQPAVAHALKVRSALALGNYHRFFQLYLDTPNMGAYLMDMFIQRERLVAFANICKSYKPDVPIRFITEELGFESDQECVQFICDFQGETLLEEKESGVRMRAGKAGPLFENAKLAAFRKVDIKGQI